MISNNFKFIDFIDIDVYKIYKKEACNPMFFKTSLENEGNVFGQYGTLHSTSLFSSLAILRMLLDKSNGTFVDLGCGVGIPIIHALHHGWTSIGIEISKGAFECCKKNIKTAIEKKYIIDKNYQLFNTSFFPKDFEITTDSNFNQDDFREELNKLQNANNSHIDSKELIKGDFFFHYQVERRQNILNLFSEYGKKDSFLLFVATREDKYVLPDEIKEIDNWKDIFLYKKII